MIHDLDSNLPVVNVGDVVISKNSTYDAIKDPKKEGRCEGCNFKWRDSCPNINCDNVILIWRKPPNINNNISL